MDVNKPVEVVRLSRDQFTQLKRQLYAPIVTNETTAHSAGFLLGIRFVLDKIEEGYVIGS